MVALMLAVAADAHALTARVRWMPSAGGIGYEVFVRPSGQPYAAGIDAGLPAAGVGGELAYDVANLTDGVTYYFTVVARGAGGIRSACAGELVLGDLEPCLVERCCPGEACAFGAARDGTPCDDADACRRCLAAACTATPESPLDSRRLRLTRRASLPRVSASGTFTPSEGFDPTAEGLTLSFFDAAGTVVLRAFVPADAVQANDAGTAFVLAPDQRDGVLRMLSLRLRKGGALVRARLVADLGAAAGPLGWAVTSAGSCGRSAALACSATSAGLSCR